MKRLPQFFEIRSAGGHRVLLSDYGARLCRWEVPNQAGNSHNVVLGFLRPEDYLSAHEPYHGAVIGRCAGRIRQAHAPLRGRFLQLTANEGIHHLHGGPAGFHACFWQSERLEPGSILFRLLHSHGLDGYPGDLTFTVIYKLDDPDSLRLFFEATANAPTPIAPSHHPFWNLHGTSCKQITSHRLQLWSKLYFPINRELLSTGTLESVKGTALDFNRPRSLREILEAEDPQVHLAGGLDHTFLGSDTAPSRDNLRLQARVEEADSGLSLEVWSSFPCLQVYSGQKLTGADVGWDGAPHAAFSGLCLEPCFYPDFLNHVGFEGPILEPGKTFTASILYRVTTL
jgi:aldose 1-epimerase